MDVKDFLPLLREVLGSPVEVARAGLLKEGQDYSVWAVDLSAPDLRLVVKLGGPEAAYTCAFERTAAVHRLVGEQAGLEVPEVLAADESYRRWPWRYFIKTYLPGQEWAEVAEQVDPRALEDARAELGAHVARLHRITFNGFGAINSDGTVRNPMRCYDALAWHARQIIVKAPAALDFFLQALEARRMLFEREAFSPTRTPSLCHEDLHQYNILLRETPAGWRIATILDFEKSWAGHRETDLARMDLWDMTGERFWESYQQIYPLEEGYAERRPIYQLLWCLEYAKQTPAHLETTRVVCEELGLPAVEQFRPVFRLKTPYD